MLSAPWLGEGLGGEILRTSLGWMFLIAGAVKVRRPLLASLTIVDFRLARRAPLATGLLHGVGELALGLWLVSGLAPQLACVVAAITLIGFVALITRSLHRGDRFPCRCFGDGESELSVATALRTAGLAVAAWVAAVSVEVTPALESGSARLLLVVGGGALTATVMVGAWITRLVRWNSLRGYVAL